jgi:hypothetical protein
MTDKFAVPLDKDALYFGEEMRDAILAKWDEMTDQMTAIHLPKGWSDLVDRMLTEVSEMCGKKTVGSLKAAWGNLESDVWITRRSGNMVTLYEIQERYRMESQRTCYVCGGHGRRKILGNEVQVLCGGCAEHLTKPHDAVKTGTWLDNF